MATGFPFTPIPRDVAPLIGTPDEGTRIFRAEGNHDQMRRWFEALCDQIGPCVSPGGAAVYSGASRAGVYKKMKAGGLTTFCFHITGSKKTWLGRDKKLKEWALVYIPVDECKAWRAELEERLARIESQGATQDDKDALDEADPGEDNPDPDFIHYDPRDKKRWDVKYMTGDKRIEDQGDAEAGN